MNGSGEGSEAAADCHRVTWFVPERPVEGNTLYATDDRRSHVRRAKSSQPAQPQGE